MQKVILHEGLAAGVLNEGFAGGSGTTWKDELCNDHVLLKEIMERLEHDYENTLPKMRRPYSQKDLEVWCALLSQLTLACFFDGPHQTLFSVMRAQETLQKTCGMYLSCLRIFEKKVPQEFFRTELVDIQVASLDNNKLTVKSLVCQPSPLGHSLRTVELRFRNRHADGDLQALMDSTVPPADLSRVGIFSSSLVKWEKKAIGTGGFHIWRWRYATMTWFSCLFFNVCCDMLVGGEYRTGSKGGRAPQQQVSASNWLCMSPRFGMV